MKTPCSQAPKQLNATLRWLLLAAGFAAVALAVVGIFLPVLPTVPFLLLALACFGRSSQRFYAWLLEHAHLGPIVRPYLGGKGLTRTSKLKAISLVWISIAASVLFLLETTWVRVILLIVACSVSLYMLRLPTLAAGDQDHLS
jgi:uncharacterized membrane protein YbaN (DUF454 family)